MANAIVEPAVGDGLRGTATPARCHRLAVPRHLGLVPWAAASVLVVTAVAHFQATSRAPLTWDEARRVDAGAALDLVLSGAGPRQAWDWLTALDLPFVAPALHAVVLALGGDPAVAAWLPSIAAFAVAGLLAGLLARTLGAGTAGSWVAAALVWTTPIGARLAAGAFTENLGACLLAGLVLVLGHLRRRPSIGVALAAGSVVAVAWWTSPEYGLTAAAVAALGTVALGGGAARPRRLHLLTGATAVGLVLAHAEATGSVWQPAHALGTLVADHWSLGATDLLFYPRALFGADGFARAELGLSPAVAALLVLGALWAVVAWRRRPEWRLPVVAVAVWAAVYVPAGAREARFVTLVLPVLAALAGAGTGDLLASRRLRPAIAAGGATLAVAVAAAADLAVVLLLLPLAAVLAAGALAMVTPERRRRAGAAAAAVAVAAGLAFLPAQIGDQASALRTQLWFVEPNEPADLALAFIGSQLPPTGSRPVLMIGAASALSPQLVQLEWDHRLGERSAGVHLVAEVDAAHRRRQLAETLAALRPAMIVSVRTGSASRLAPDRTATGEELLPGQRDYARFAVELARTGHLTLVASLTFEHDPARIDVWRPSTARRGGDDRR